MKFSVSFIVWALAATVCLAKTTTRHAETAAEKEVRAERELTWSYINNHDVKPGPGGRIDTGGDSGSGSGSEESLVGDQFLKKKKKKRRNKLKGRNGNGGKGGKGSKGGNGQGHKTKTKIADNYCASICHASNKDMQPTCDAESVLEWKEQAKTDCCCSGGVSYLKLEFSSFRYMRDVGVVGTFSVDTSANNSTNANRNQKNNVRKGRQGRQGRQDAVTFTTETTTNDRAANIRVVNCGDACLTQPLSDIACSPDSISDSLEGVGDGADICIVHIDPATNKPLFDEKFPKNLSLVFESIGVESSGGERSGGERFTSTIHTSCSDPVSYPWAAMAVPKDGTQFEGPVNMEGEWEGYDWPMFIYQGGMSTGSYEGAKRDGRNANQIQLDPAQCGCDCTKTYDHRWMDTHDPTTFYPTEHVSCGPTMTPPDQDKRGGPGGDIMAPTSPNGDPMDPNPDTPQIEDLNTGDPEDQPTWFPTSLDANNGNPTNTYSPSEPVTIQFQVPDIPDFEDASTEQPTLPTIAPVATLAPSVRTDAPNADTGTESIPALPPTNAPTAMVRNVPIPQGDPDIAVPTTNAPTATNGDGQTIIGVAATEPPVPAQTVSPVAPPTAAPIAVTTTTNAPTATNGDGQTVIGVATLAPLVPAPTVSPVAPPTAAPVPAPTMAPVPAPTAAPVPAPTLPPVPAPTLPPVPAPTSSPTLSPTRRPTPTPTKLPTVSPTTSPTISLAVAPTDSPTDSPPTASPSDPSDPPSQFPSCEDTSLHGGYPGLAVSREANTCSMDGSKSIYDYLCSVNNFSNFCAMVQGAGLRDMFSGHGDDIMFMTLFAPTNQGCKAGGLSIKEIDRMDKDKLKQIVMTHATEGKVLSQNLTCDAQLPTLKGTFSVHTTKCFNNQHSKAQFGFFNDEKSYPMILSPNNLGLCNGLIQPVNNMIRVINF